MECSKKTRKPPPGNSSIDLIRDRTTSARSSPLKVGAMNKLGRQLVIIGPQETDGNIKKILERAAPNFVGETLQSGRGERQQIYRQIVGDGDCKQLSAALNGDITRIF